MPESANSIGVLLWLRRAKRAAKKIVGTKEDKKALVALDQALDRACELVRESAPELWETDAEMAEIIAGRPAACRLPREFAAVPALAHAVGMPLMMGGGGVLTLDGEALDLQVLREALIQLGAAKLPPVLYFGPWSRPGHYLYDPDGRSLHGAAISEMGFQVDAHGLLALRKSLDPYYCPGVKEGDPAYKRRSEVEGHAKLTHENGMTVLGIWDRSVDTRGGSHSTYIALGCYGFDTMIKLCSTVYAERWNRLTGRGVVVKLVESEDA